MQHLSFKTSGIKSKTLCVQDEVTGAYIDIILGYDPTHVVSLCTSQRGISSFCFTPAKGLTIVLRSRYYTPTVGSGEANNQPITDDTRDTALTCSVIVRRERRDGGMMEGKDGFRTKEVKNSGGLLRTSNVAVVFQCVSSA